MTVPDSWYQFMAKGMNLAFPLIAGVLKSQAVPSEARNQQSLVARPSGQSC